MTLNAGVPDSNEKFRTESRVERMSESHAADAADAFALSQLMFPTTAVCISVAARHGLADVLAEGSLSAGQLAERTGTDEVQLGKVLRLLAEEGVFREVGPDVFANSRLSHLLRKGFPRSQHAMATLVGEPWLWNSWSKLSEGLASGRPGFELAHGMALWAYLAGDAAAGVVFNDAMRDFSEALSDLVASSYPAFTDGGVVADLGGGTGTYLRAILRTYPSVERGVLADLPAVIEQAETSPELAELLASGRLGLHGGDFFDAVPAGVDVYVVKQVMHSWDDDSIIRLLRRCRETSPEATFVAAEFVRDTKASRFVKNFDLIMTITMNGNIRTEAQYATVFEKGGYELTSVLPTDTAFSLVEARPVARP
ncbi:methyltransferase [Amycolatopsis taiwanensis]|nr:methyltransferase [Amycolatopsis taiwanensis]